MQPVPAHKHAERIEMPPRDAARLAPSFRSKCSTVWSRLTTSEGVLTPPRDNAGRHGHAPHGGMGASIVFAPDSMSSLKMSGLSEWVSWLMMSEAEPASTSPSAASKKSSASTVSASSPDEHCTISSSDSGSKTTLSMPVSMAVARW